jgi:hypothetical protein
MAPFDELLFAIDEYTLAKDALKTESADVCYDWDCGIANEMGGAFAAASNGDGLNKARQTLEAALDKYVDLRVQAAVEKLMRDRKV